MVGSSKTSLTQIGGERDEKGEGAWKELVKSLDFGIFL